MKRHLHIIGIIGLLLALYGIISAVFYSNILWYSYFVVGGTLFLAYANCRLKNDSILKHDRKYILKTYGIYLLFTILIEIAGRFVLGLWNYPFFSLMDEFVHVFLIGYPFVFFFVRESFVMINKKTGLLAAIILTTLVNAFVHEIPNTFVWVWVYTIPYVTLEIFQINIVVIVGWAILVLVPLITKRIIDR
ncbi:MAG: hypothetical protein HYT73_04255 [Candidatus Aenigmarchaeota archaeon]|nr:hypothetical protein [Candidatus Aenigmarchaeota archaeon]